ncbi:hypothetical protein ABZ915_05460 [Streptomyces sp. NPDC046915]
MAMLYLQNELNHASWDLHHGLVAREVHLAQSLVVQWFEPCAG